MGDTSTLKRRRPPSKGASETELTLLRAHESLSKLTDEVKGLRERTQTDIGEYEDIELARDVYSTAFLIAKNATPGMYTIWPWRNPQVRLLWLFLAFIVFSQAFALVAITCIFPPVTSSTTFLVDCSTNSTLTLSQLDRVGLAFADCEENSSPEVEVQGVLLRRVEVEKYYYQNIFANRCIGTIALQVFCCTWVLCCVYYRDHQRIEALLEYNDFNRYFLPLKGEEVSNGWAIVVPLTEWVLSVSIVCVSFAVICGYDTAFDIVLNSLAFTFIAEVPEYFNEPLVKRYSRLSIATLEEGGMMDGKAYGDVKYLYPDYAEENYLPTSWYILRHHQSPGLLNDYCFRRKEGDYDNPAASLITVLQWLFWILPVVTTLLSWFHLTRA